MAKVLCHPDEVSGTTVQDSGRKFYWTEAFSSYNNQFQDSIVVVIHPDGRKEMFLASSRHPLAEELSSPDEHSTEYLVMTPEQEKEYKEARVDLSNGNWMKYLPHG